MTYKKFDNELYKQNDAKARSCAITYFENKGFIVSPNPNRFDVDLDLFRGDKKKGIIEEKIGHVECEIKKVWREKKFPYDSIQIPERKRKYITNNKLPILFFMLNEPCNRALIIKGEDLIKCPTKEVKNKYVAENEMFFIIPISLCTFVDIEPSQSVVEPKPLQLSEDTINQLVESTIKCTSVIDKIAFLTDLFGALKFKLKKDDSSKLDLK